MTSQGPDGKGYRAGLLAKWELLGCALASKQLSAADCAVLHYLCDRYDEEMGYAWPSLDTIAARTGRDRKTVRRAINDLRDAGLIAVEPGDRVRPNHYRPCFGAQVGAILPLQVGAKLSKGRGEIVPKVGAKLPLNSTYDPGYEAGGHGGSPAAHAAGAGGGATPAAAPAPAGATRRYADFWSAYPKATQVFAAEKLIDELLRGGVQLPDIVAGAAAYGRHVAMQPWQDKNRYTAGAVNWLRDRRWLDDYAQTLEGKPASRGKTRRRQHHRVDQGKDFAQ